MFEIVDDRRVPLPPADEPVIGPLLAYWESRRLGAPMPRREDIDPAAMSDCLGRVHLLDVVDAGTFRYRVYGSLVTNPDRMDMTGRTTAEYHDAGFGRMVTRHLSACCADAAPVCHHILGRLDGEPYEYRRLVLPLGDGAPSMLLVGTRRIDVPGDATRERLAATGAARP